MAYFPPRYFAAWYFAPRYYPQPPAGTGVGFYFPASYFATRYFAPRYFSQVPSPGGDGGEPTPGPGGRLRILTEVRG